MKENDLTIKEARSRQYPAKIITDANYTDDLPLLVNLPVQTDCLLHHLEQAVRGAGLYANSDKTEFLCPKQDGAIHLYIKW